ncbi:efflux RND transporter permease subunit, partial [bacterium]|nr:efflux RND transporter permease subunit [bacterium]
LAVVAVTLTIIAVFMPIGFLSGVVGQFFKQFGLTVCFIMMISLFDALTNAPMMSAYFGGVHGEEPKEGIRALLRTPVKLFDQLQTWLEEKYSNLLRVVLRRPAIALGMTVLVVISSCVPLFKVPKTFLPPQDSGEFAVSLDMVPGTSLEKMRDRALAIDSIIRKNSAVVNTVLTVGTNQGEKNKAEFFVNLKPFEERSITTSQVKDQIRDSLKSETDVNPKVKDVDYVGGGMRPFTLNIVGQDLQQIEDLTSKLMEKLKNHPALEDVDVSYRPGKPEYQIVVDLPKAQRLGVTSPLVGRELRGQVEGITPAVYRENGLEYDIRLRLAPEQRDLEVAYDKILVPNLNFRLVNLSDVAKGTKTTGPASINRENRGRYVAISADIAPQGPGMGGAISDVEKWLAPGGEFALPTGVSYRFVGQAENFQELVESMIAASLLGLIFIYLVLSSLYESFFTPFTIMLVIPLAACGAFFALFIAGKSLDLYSMIGCIMLMGLATKNSIILIDYIKQLTDKGIELKQAILEAGKTRLRPILMTSFALIAGMIPVAVGLNEVSNERTSLGVAVIGGVLSSTLLTLIVIPAVYTYMEWMRAKLIRFGSRFVN